MLPRAMNPEITHFGFTDVPREEKAARVRGVFDSVASRYDLMNDLMSGGLHRYWKNAMVGHLPRRSGLRLLDLAGGTGDIAFRALERNPEAQITVADINASMLVEGQKNALDRNIPAAFAAADGAVTTPNPTANAAGPCPVEKRKANYQPSLTWLCADAEKLPLPSNHFDACTMAFGIRNVTEIPAALREIYRVLKPGGEFLCLEFSPLTAHHSPLSTLYDLYSFHLIPRIGQAVTGDAASYQYLVESIRRFPDPENFAGMIRKAGFGRVSYERFTFGVVSLHRGWKI